jgi:hypothetical protein
VHAAFIDGHAASGVLAFVAGCVSLRHRRAFAIYFWALGALVVFLVAALAVDWAGLGAVLRAVFTALTGLAFYLVWRAMHARQLRAAPFGPAAVRYVDDVGFTLIALFDGFAIIAVITSGGPGWLAAVVGVAAVLAGSVIVRRLKARVPAVAAQSREAATPAARSRA